MIATEIIALALSHQEEYVPFQAKTASTTKPALAPPLPAGFNLARPLRSSGALVSGGTGSGAWCKKQRCFTK